MADEKAITKNYEKTKHKIFNLWNYIIRLTATDEELLEKISGLEKSIEILSKREMTSSDKQWVYKVTNNYAFGDLTMEWHGGLPVYYLTVKHNLNILFLPIVNIYRNFEQFTDYYYNIIGSAAYNPPVEIIDSNTCKFTVAFGYYFTPDPYGPDEISYLIDTGGSYIIMG